MKKILKKEKRIKCVYILYMFINAMKTEITLLNIFNRKLIINFYNFMKFLEFIISCFFTIYLTRIFKGVILSFDIYKNIS